MTTHYTLLHTQENLHKNMKQAALVTARFICEGVRTDAQTTDFNACTQTVTILPLTKTKTPV